MIWPQTTLTIAFRGLLVIHKVESVEPNFFEIGVVPDEHHFLRIHTIKNGVLASTKFLKDTHAPDEDNGEADGPHGDDHGDDHGGHPPGGDNRRWVLEVDYPLGTGVMAYTSGTFNRLTHSDERDYRWITELGDFFENFSEKLDPSKFSPCVKIPQGIFYTRLKSPELSKVTDDSSERFGSIAAVVACDIPMIQGQARLIEHSTGDVLFTFEPDENTIYEFANTPCDVPDHHGPHPGQPERPEHPPAGEGDPCEGNHFKLYYKILRDPDAEDSICFVKPGPRPAPDPALCGAAGGGGEKDPFSNP